MQHEVRNVVPPGVEAKPLAVEHVGDPASRMPIRKSDPHEGPQHAAEAQAATDKGILVDVVGIVELDEGVMGRLPEDGVDDTEAGRRQMKRFLARVDGEDAGMDRVFHRVGQLNESHHPLFHNT